MFLQPVESGFEIPDLMKVIHWFIKTITASQTELNMQFDTIMWTLENMLIEKKILAYENAGLLKALVREKKRRRRGKNMGLFLKNKPNQTMFFFLNKINTAQNQQQFLNAQKEQKKFEKKLKAEAKVEKKKWKAWEVQECKKQKTKKATEKAAQKQFEKKIKKFQKQVNQ